MPLHLLPSLLLLILVWGLTPGPANIYAMGSALRYGFKPALRMWWGLLTGFTIAMTAVALITHFLGTEIEAYAVYIKYLGAAYIAWVALGIFRSRGKIRQDNRDCNFTSGMIVQLTNAKIIIFDFMVFSIYVQPYSNRLIDLFLAGLLVMLAGPGANLAWIAVGAWFKRFFDNYHKQVDVVMSAALLICACIIAF